MTDEHQVEPEPIELANMTPAEVARVLRCSIADAREHIAIARDEWCGDVWVVDADGIERPTDHGANWNPGPGQRRTHLWPDGTDGPKPLL